MSTYYNENDPKIATWLRELIRAGLIAPGEVDERSIIEVKSGDLHGYSQCHFFAGIGTWSHTLRRAGWPDDIPVWTGSCPCQSFSASGQRGGFSDQRHLWPAWFRLIRECAPDCIFGEQVASGDGLAWLDVVSADLEGAGYAIGAADLCAAGFGAPHIRQRLYFVAHTTIEGRQSRRGRFSEQERTSGDATACTKIGGMAHAEGGPVCEPQAWNGRQGDGANGEAGKLADAAATGSLPGTHRRICSGEKDAGSRDAEPERHGELGQPKSIGRGEGRAESAREQGGQTAGGPSIVNGFWRDAEWLPCRDGKFRPVEPKFVAVVDRPAGDLGLMRDADSREQRTRKLADFVRLLSSSLALAQLHGDTRTSEAMLALLKASGAEGLVQYPSEQAEEIWRSAPEEVQNRLWMGITQGGILRTIEHPLAHGAAARVVRLRGYGNAIVPQVAEAFIRAYMEHLGEGR